MKKILLLAAAAIMAAGALQAKTADEFRIYLNPGHGSFGANDRPMKTIGHPNTGVVNAEGTTWIDTDTLGFYEGRGTLPRAFGIGSYLKSVGVKSENIVYSRTANGPWPYSTPNSQYDPEQLYNKPLAVICEEVEEGNFDMFISSHSNAATDGTTTNYPLFLYRGYDTGQTGDAGYNGPGVPGSDEMGRTVWPYHYMGEIEPQSHYSVTNTNVRGDINFYGSYSTATRNNGNQYSGYLGVLKHGVPGYLNEGFFHTYQPARHRALNFDYDRLEGIREARGVATYWGFTLNGKGEIAGTVKDLHEKIVNNLYTYAYGSDDQWLPLNGAVVTLKKDGAEVASYTCDNEWNGFFAFFNLDPGSYTVEATCNEYKVLEEPIAVTVSANQTSYAFVKLENENYVPEKIVYENYPDPAQPGYLKLAGTFVFGQDDGTTYDGIVGNIAQMLQYGDSTIVLSHEGTLAHLYIVDNNTKQVVKNLNTEGLFTMTDNLGFYNQIGSIALSADRKLVGVTAVRNSYSDADLSRNPNGGAGYQRGTMHAYYWDNFDAAPTDWFATQYSSNWYNADLGFGVAVSGPIEECVVCVPAPTSGSSRGIRPAFFAVQNGQVVSTSRANANATIALTELGDPLAIEGNIDGYPVANFGYIKVAVSPFDDNAFIIGGSKAGKLYEFPITADGAVPTYNEFNADAELLGNGLQIFKYAKHSLMVAPYGADNSVNGIKIYDITNGLANASLVKTINTDIAAAEGAPALQAITANGADFAWAGAAVNQEAIRAFLLGSDGNIVRFATDDEGVEQPIVKGIYAYDLRYVKNEDSYTFSFKANDNANEATITFRDLDSNEELATMPIENVVLGENTITIPADQIPAVAAGKLQWEITLVGEPIARIDLLSELNNDNVYSGCLFNNIDKNPESPHFGNIYVGNRISQPNEGNGLYVYDPLMNRQNSTAYHGTTMLSSPYRLAVAPDGTVYIPDWSDPYSGVYVADPDNIEADFTQFFEGERAGSGLFTNNGVNVGGSATSVAFIGKGADTKMYVFSEDVPGPSGNGNGVAIYNVGNEDGTIAKTWGVAPNNYFDIGAKMLNTNGNVVPTEDGGAFVSQVRSAGNNQSGVPSFVYVNPEGSIVFNSGIDLQDLNGSLGGGLAISNDGNTLVINNGTGAIEFFDLAWNDAVPVITPRGYSFVSAARRDDGSSHNNYIYQMNFDYGGNLVVTGNKVAMYSIPTDNNRNTTPSTMEIENTGMTEFYLVGSFTEPAWSQEEDVRIPFVEDGDGNFVATDVVLAAEDEFKIITPANDGWTWLGGEHESTDYFLVTPNFYNNATEITLVPDDPEGKGNFRMEYGPATYKITIKNPSEVPADGIAPKGLQAPLVMVMEKTTGINTINTGKKVVSVKYVNLAGIESETPFQGVNIVVTRYEDGSQTSTKVIK